MSLWSYCLNETNLDSANSVFRDWPHVQVYMFGGVPWFGWDSHLNEANTIIWKIDGGWWRSHSLVSHQPESLGGTRTLIFVRVGREPRGQGEQRPRGLDDAAEVPDFKSVKDRRRILVSNCTSTMAPMTNNYLDVPDSSRALRDTRARCEM